MQAEKQKFLDPQFVYGLNAGIILICSFLILFKGMQFTFHGLQIRAYHVIYISLVYLFGYWKLEKADDFSRFFLAFAYAFFIWMIHDTLSTLVGLNQGVFRFFDETKEVSISIIASIWIRNLTLAVCCLFTLRKHVRRNWKTFALIPIQASIWIWISFRKSVV